MQCDTCWRNKKTLNQYGHTMPPKQKHRDIVVPLKDYYLPTLASIQEEQVILKLQISPRHSQISLLNIQFFLLLLFVLFAVPESLLEWRNDFENVHYCVIRSSLRWFNPSTWNRIFILILRKSIKWYKVTDKATCYNFSDTNGIFHSCLHFVNSHCTRLRWEIGWKKKLWNMNKFSSKHPIAILMPDLVVVIPESQLKVICPRLRILILTLYQKISNHAVCRKNNCLRK